MLANYGILTAFWISVNLINTLWILLFTCPVTFYIVNQALITADSTIGEYKALKTKKAE
jgi:hypothetical protein